MSLLEQLEARMLLAASPTYLSDLNWTSATSPYSGIKKDASSGGSTPLRIGGVSYTKGLGVHSASSVTYNLAGQYTTFQSYVGIDDSVGNGSIDGSSQFLVYVDGVLKKTSSRRDGSQPAELIEVDVTGAQTLRLVTNTGGNPGDNDYKDHADWADAKLLAEPPAANPSISVTTPGSSVAENGGPAARGQFVISRIGPSDQDLLVYYTLGGTATNGTDYTSLTGTITLPAGQTSASVYVDPIDDSTFEGDETVYLKVDPKPNYAVLQGGDGTVTILENEPEPVRPNVSVAATDNAAAETDQGQAANTGTFTLTRDGDTTDPLTVNFTLGGTAAGGSDYTAVPLSLTIPAGQASATLTISPVNDAAFENTESVVLTLSQSPLYIVNPGANSATVSIADNDPVPPQPEFVYLSDLNWTRAVSPYDAARKNTSANGFPISIGGVAYAKGVGVHSASELVYDLGGQYTRFTAAVGMNDSVGNDGSSQFLVYVDGVLKKTSTRRTGADGAELIDVDITGGQTLRLVTNTGGLPGDNDYRDQAVWADAKLFSTPAVVKPAVSVARTTDGAEPSTDVVFTFTRTGDTTDPLTIFFTRTGTATAGGDYANAPLQVTIPAGESSVAYTLDVTDDSAYEGDETVNLAITANAAYTIAGGGGSAAATITDDDPVPTGLTAQYFDNADFTSPVVTRLDPAIDMGGSGPAWNLPTTDADSFSVRWSGLIDPPETGTYQFTLASDHGARLWINGKLVVDTWTSSANNTGSINLTAGQKVGILIEYYELTGGESIALSWQPPSFGNAQIVPSARLSPAQPPAGNPLRIIAVGDSITEGEKDHASYRFWLDRMLASTGLNFNFVGARSGAHNSGVGGANVQPLYPWFDQDHQSIWGGKLEDVNALTTPAADIALIHIGHNDIRGGQTPQSLIAELSAYIDKLRTINPNIRIAIAQPVKNTSLGFVAEMDQYRALIPGLVNSRSTLASPIVAVDQYTGFDPATMTYDQVHPNEIGEKQIAERFYAAIQQLRAGLSGNAAAPSGLSRQVLSSSSVKLNWTDNSNNETGFQVLVNGAVSQTTAQNANTITLTGLTPGQAYTFQIKALPGGAASNQVSATLPTNPTPTIDFYKGINFGGGAVTIDGNAWIGQSAAQSSGLAFTTPFTTSTTSVTPVPATDAATSSMLNSVAWRSQADLGFSQAVENGTYDVYFYVMENYQSNFRNFSILAEGQTVQQSAGNMARGSWQKYGAYRMDVADGKIDVTFRKISGDTHVMGMSIFRVTTEPPRVITVAATDNQAEESGGTAAFTFTRTGDLTSALTVNFTLGGAATNGTDYAALPSSITFDEGSDTAILTLTASDDSVYEGDELATLTLAAGTGYTLGTPKTASVTIVDDEPVPPTVTIAATDSAAAETPAGQTANTGTFTLTRTGDTTDPLTVDFTVSGTASSGGDYQALGTSVVIPAGQASVTLTVTPVDNSVFEGAETVIVTLSPSSGASYLVGQSGSATVTISDDEVQPPTITVAAIDSSGAEQGAGGSNPNTITFRLTRTGPTTGALDVPVTFSGPAIGGQDFTAAAEAHFDIGQSTATLVVTPIDDSLVEGTESLTLSIPASQNGAYVAGSPASASASILDNDAPVTGLGTGLKGEYFDEMNFQSKVFERIDPQINFNWGSGAPDSRMNGDTFSVRWSGQIEATHSETYTFYSLHDDGMRVFVNGQKIIDRFFDQGASTEWTGTIALEANRKYDIVVEYYENVVGAQARLSWSSPSRPKEVIPAKYLYTLPVANITAADASAREDGNSGAFTITLGYPPATPTVVQYTITGTAANGADYTMPGTVTIPAGQSSASVTVSPIDDALNEGLETVIVTLQDGSGYFAGTSASATVNLFDDETGQAPPPLIREPAIDNQSFSAFDVHMVIEDWVDPNDPSRPHDATDWEIWTAGPGGERIWHATNITDPALKVHIHFADGTFENSHAGRTSLNFESDYVLRARVHTSGATPQLDTSDWSYRPFSTNPEIVPIPNAPDWTVSEPGYKVEVVQTGLTLPVKLVFVPEHLRGDHPSDPSYYVLELYGAVKVVTNSGQISTYASELLNYSPFGGFPGSGEQGAGGITIDPDTGDVIVTLVHDKPGDGGTALFPAVIRLKSTDGGITASSVETILDMPNDPVGPSHQISEVSYGPDGKLYVNVGDGFTWQTAQDLTTLRGKVLRMNDDGTPATDNPFYNAADGITARDFVFAYGFRNPFGASWRLSDGRYYEVENGPQVDRFAHVRRGENYGWNNTNDSMRTGALYNWGAPHAPAGLAFIEPGVFGGSGFESRFYGHGFVAESGPTYATGPQGAGKRITRFNIDSNGRLVGSRNNFITYNGTGKATVVDVQSGPDGLYFVDLYADQPVNGTYNPTNPGARVLRVVYTG